MNNEEKILEILVQMQQEQKSTSERLDRLESGQAELKAEMNDRFSEMNDRFSEMNDRFDSVELKIDEAWKDLSHLEDRVDFHDTAIKSIM